MLLAVYTFAVALIIYFALTSTIGRKIQTMFAALRNSLPSSLWTGQRKVTHTSNSSIMSGPARKLEVAIQEVTHTSNSSIMSGSAGKLEVAIQEFTHTSNSSIMSGPARKSKVAIHEIAEGNSVTITKEIDGKTRIDHDALMNVFDHPVFKDKPFAIISITGQMRTGKSFLMNFIIRYLRNEGWKNENWMGDNDFAMATEDFVFKAGHERCTTGIKVFNKVFEVEAENETLMVILMDCQGLFDHKTPQDVNKALLTLTTLMSSVQIFNSIKQIDSQQLHYLKTCLDFAELAAEKSMGKNLKESYFQLQDLVFLIRDSKETKSTAEENFGFAPGKKYMDDFLMSTSGPDELVKTQTRIQKSFKTVECYMMPFPGSGVEKEAFAGKNGAMTSAVS